MNQQQLYDLKEALTNAEYELEKIQGEVTNLSPEDKELFDSIVIW